MRAIFSLKTQLYKNLSYLSFIRYNHEYFSIINESHIQEMRTLCLRVVNYNDHLIPHQNRAVLIKRNVRVYQDTVNDALMDCKSKQTQES